MEEGSRLGDGCLTQRAQVNGETKDHVVKDPQSLVVAKLLECLLDWETLVSTGRVKLLDTANAA